MTNLSWEPFRSQLTFNTGFKSNEKAGDLKERRKERLKVYCEGVRHVDALGILRAIKHD